MEQENKRKYEAPHLTVVEFKTEQGFATSSAGVSNYRNNPFESWGFTGGDGGSGSGVPGYTNHDSEVW